MATYEVGQVIEWVLRTYVDRAGGRLGSLEHLPVATVTKPDGTTAAASVANNSTGIYVATFTTTLPGRHRVRWTPYPGNPLATPTPIPADVSDDLPYTDIADVWPTDPKLIISLEDARASLNLPSTSRANDDELRLYVAAATEVIEHRVGAVLSATRVETLSGMGEPFVSLHEFPTAITTVVENGVTLAATAYCFENERVWRGSAPGAGVWSALAPRNVVITYTAGDSTVPPGIVKAARELVRHQYSVSQQASRPSFDDGTGEPNYSAQSSWFAVVDALDAHASGRVPGLA